MTEQGQGDWWDSLSPDYDKKREQRLRAALMSLIERDVNFALDAMVLGLGYPDDVTLSVESREQGDAFDADEGPSDDWYFRLEGPAFKVVLYAAGRADVALECRDASILHSDTVFVDRVSGEQAALDWLNAPPMPEVRGHR